MFIFPQPNKADNRDPEDTFNKVTCAICDVPKVEGTRLTAMPRKRKASAAGAEGIRAVKKLQRDPAVSWTLMNGDWMGNKLHGQRGNTGGIGCCQRVY